MIHENDWFKSRTNRSCDCARRSHNQMRFRAPRGAFARERTDGHVRLLYDACSCPEITRPILVRIDVRKVQWNEANAGPASKSFRSRCPALDYRPALLTNQERS